MILYEEELGGDARWSKLAELFPRPKENLSQAQYEDRLDKLQAAYWRIGMHVAHQKDDGYIGHREALQLCRGKQWVLDALTAKVRGKPPFLHKPGDTCSAKNCIDSSPPWVEGYEYRICAFLKRNPSRKEKERHDGQKRERDDPVLRAYLFKRDGGCCRFCRSGPMKPKGMGRAKDRRRIAVVAHLDPDQLAGPDRLNVVLGCAFCNEYQGHRTPDEAGMGVLPEPSPELVAYWYERGEQLFDRPEPGEQSPADILPDKPPDKASTTLSTALSDKTPGVVHGLVQGVVEASFDAIVSAGEQQEQAGDKTSEGAGSGRGGKPPAVPVLGHGGQPVRTPDAPDIWTRRSRAPDPVAGPP